jgi:hypothetical protein
VDRGALDAALASGVDCGGWCPAGRLAEDGRIPERYPFVELPNANYSERTLRNVADSDGTLMIANGALIGGTRETLDRCVELRKPHLVVDCQVTPAAQAAELVLKFVARNEIRVLNVAGPRASQWPEAQASARQIISGVLRRLSGHKHAGEYNA